ncbi:Aph-1, partial [Rhizopus microsporus var. microsporus]
MSLLSFFGCLFLAYGPILSIFILFIAPTAQYVLLTVASAFFCLIALLLSSVIWYASRTNYYISILYSIVIQEICRYCFYLLQRRAEHGLNSISANPMFPFNKHIFSFVFGYGYALTSALVGYISLLVESIGPGVLMCESCPQATLYFISAITTSLFSLLHIGWMMISFEGYSELPKPRGYCKILWVILSHYGASFATTLNSSPTVKYGCIYSIFICLFIILISSSIIILSLKSKFK